MTNDFASLAVNGGSVIAVDACDADFLKSAKWRYARHGKKPGDKFYVSGRINGKHVYLHRLIAGAQRGQIVDHINGDTLDNRRCNLRLVSASQNMFNRAKPVPDKATSRFKGVTKNGRKWRAYIRRKDQGQIELGNFENEVEAAFAYDLASLELHGAHGKRNFLPLAA